MKYTKEQTEKIMKYIETKAKEGVIAECVDYSSRGKHKEVVYSITYGSDPYDVAEVRFTGSYDLETVSLSNLITNYKNYKTSVIFPKWELTWNSESADDNLEVLNTICKIEAGIPLSEYIKTYCEEKKQKSLIDRFFEEN